jgi:dienelactone hydrolase
VSVSRHPLIVVAMALCAVAVTARPARAEIKTQEIEYKQGQTPLLGFVAWDDAIKGKRPGVLIVHEWWGHNQHARNQAKRLAQAGYVGFALDMFGKGKLAQHPKDAMAFVNEATKDPAVTRARFEAALAQLKGLPQVDATKLAAIGYCFGGAVVLDMARSGMELAAVATFHGSLGSKLVAKKGAIKPRILVMTGAEDPMIGPPAVDAFRKEMTEAGARFEVVSYPGVKHSFTNPDADKAGVPGLAYNEAADKQSWESFLKLMREAFPASPAQR